MRFGNRWLTFTIIIGININIIRVTLWIDLDHKLLRHLIQVRWEVGTVCYKCGSTGSAGDGEEPWKDNGRPWRSSSSKRCAALSISSWVILRASCISLEVQRTNSGSQNFPNPCSTSTWKKSVLTNKYCETEISDNSEANNYINHYRKPSQ